MSNTSCSLCFSYGTNRANCPFNKQAQNPDCDKHYNAQIIQRVRNYTLGEGVTDCRNDSYNPQELASSKTSCVDKHMSSKEYFVDSSPRHRYLKTSHLCGKGSFKEVFLARDLKKDIKKDKSFVVLAEIDVTRLPKNLRPRLLNEVKVMTKNNHPNVVEFYGSWYDSKSKKINIIIEHLVGGDLGEVFRTRIRNNLRFTSVELSKMFKDILLGFEYIHARRLIHRDVKPDNIGIASNGRLKLFDFGLTSKELDQEPVSSGHPTVLLRQASVENEQKDNIPLGRAKTMMGTPNYMAPEMITEIYNETIDIYAFGILALEFLAFNFQYSNNEAGFAILMYQINKMYQNGSPKEEILKKEYSRVIRLSNGPKLNDEDRAKIAQIYQPYGERGVHFRNLVEDCLVHPDDRLGATELLGKYWKDRRTLGFGK